MDHTHTRTTQSYQEAILLHKCLRPFSFLFRIDDAVAAAFVQCQQIGQFLKVFGDTFFHKSCPNLC